MAKTPDDELRKLALELRQYGLLANWSEVASEPWLPVLLEMERTERARRSHEYRLRNAKIGAFKRLTLLLPIRRIFGPPIEP